MKLQRETLLRILKPNPSHEISFERRYALVRKLVLMVAVVLALWIYGRRIAEKIPVGTLAHGTATALDGGVPSVAAAGTVAAATGIYLADSPGANLERLEMNSLAQTRNTLDVAMYSFTDLELADELAKLEQRGVRVRVYRDREQYDEEESRSRGGRETATAILVNAGVAVKVKRSAVLMHMESYAQDGVFLRSGSANWSPTGLKRQDNDVMYMRSPKAAQQFEAKFESMWERDDNTVVR